MRYYRNVAGALLILAATTAPLAYVPTPVKQQELQASSKIEASRPAVPIAEEDPPSTSQPTAAPTQIPTPAPTQIPAPKVAPAPPRALPKPAGSHEDWMRAAGIAEADFSYVEFIIQHESGWNPSARNGNEGACGLVQALPCSKLGSNWQDPVVALKWGNSYVSRYGGWAGAYAFWLRNRWY